ncbi:hypothetical protein D9757_008824 [Collybiopsis confluens]|uniref:Uncharacterized protein n=1 Tax=Collybiopsis confluens TaxID=2823264 RepID=A0A8H5H3Q2_9AGAR|nr:hypothetical protein D9757_008824 [Collybiopsis confluens]
MLNIPTAESQRFESHHVWRPFEALDPRSTASILSSTLADRVPTIGPRDLLSPPDFQGALDYLNDICRGDPNFPVKFTEIPKLSMSPQELEAFIDEFIESYNSATREVPNLNIMSPSAVHNWMPTPDLTPSSSITTQRPHSINY